MKSISFILISLHPFFFFIIGLNFNQLIYINLLLTLLNYYYRAFLTLQKTSF